MDDRAFQKGCEQILRLSFFRSLVAAEPRLPLLKKVAREMAKRDLLRGGETVLGVLESAYRHLALRANAYVTAVRYFELLEAELGRSLLYAAAEVPCHGTRTTDACYGDYCVVTECDLWVAEMKSERDSFTRLANQIAGYHRAIGSVDLALAEKHQTDELSVIPTSVGIVRIGTVGARRDRARRHDTAAMNWDSLAYFTCVANARYARFYARAGWREGDPDVDEMAARLRVDLATLEASAAWEAERITGRAPAVLRQAAIESWAERAGAFPLAAARWDLPSFLWPAVLSLRVRATHGDRILRVLDQRWERARATG